MSDNKSETEKSETRTVVVGDLHGCLDELNALLTEIGFADDDRLIAVGDLIGKGPKSAELLDVFIQDPRFSSVLGNHDAAILAFWSAIGQRLNATQMNTSNQLEHEREKYYEYLNSLPVMMDLGTHVVVHAGVRPDVPLDKQADDDLLELRTLGKSKRSSRKGTPWYEVYDGEKIMLFGHWPSIEPRVGPRAIGLDTACVYGNRLTAYILETGALVSVPAKAAYRRTGNKLRRQIEESALAAEAVQAEVETAATVEADVVEV